MKILWIDDEIELLKPHIIYLQAKGYNLSTAKTMVLKEWKCLKRTNTLRYY